MESETTSPKLSAASKTAKRIVEYHDRGNYNFTKTTVGPASTDANTSHPKYLKTGTSVETLKRNIRCLFVGDLFSFGKDAYRYDREKVFIKEVGADLYRKTENSTVGITTYGFVPVQPLNLIPALNGMKQDNEDFAKHVKLQTRLRDAETASTTREAINEINDFKHVRGRANCLIFFSAQNNTKDLPPLKPPKDWKRIVAVGFDDTNLTNVVEPPRGVAVSVPYWFKKENVEEVVEAVLEAF
ncbi:hypothetical protein NECAME_17350 [Necator americanus]|uniref:Uncharacterized protein n=1 Tax=Necator americanus TaxID=51031 RepID=W2TQ36_NECAM|nr:hypothetical protein NECAME_17350 [Necator americanus]ETN83759.1 hypothetical protein NECAME_17350 [Necator americanus]